LQVVRADGVGGNRHDPRGPADPEVPVMMVRSLSTHMPLACMVVYAMHPTVLHEDSTLISGDFPHFTREYLRRHVLPSSCPVLYHNGASGNQSPRHTAQANTMAEAQRLGERLGEAVATAICGITYQSDVRLACRRTHLELQPRQLPTAGEAELRLRRTEARLEELRRARALRQAVRTAECDWFGAEETVALARAASDGRLLQAIGSCSPAEIQLVEIGPWKFVAWPGEFFVEYALAVKARSPNTHVITLANGELQGYIVTMEAAKQNLYEATNALFSPDNGSRVVQATMALIGRSSSTPGD
jgi:neutral ceramidase